MNIKLADFVIKINNLYPYIEEYCKEYLVDDSCPAEFEITSSYEDIVYEREKSAKENIYEGLEVVNYADEYLETLSVYRKIASKLLDYDVLLFHGSVISVDNEGFLFTAKSGTGKSTHTALWRKVYENRAVMINDDKPLLKITDEGAIAYGTPWDGKHRLSTNTSVKLKSIAIINRAAENSIKSLSYKEAFPMLLQQSNRGRNSVELAKVLKLVDKLSDKVKLYNLYCNMDEEAAIVAYNGMKN